MQPSGAFPPTRVQLGFGLPVEPPPRLALRRAVGPQQVGLAVYVNGVLLSNFVEPSQADVAIGSSVVKPNGYVHGFG